MPIQVTCPKCLTRFQVNEKFAGKSGPCPKCKSIIKVPTLAERVVIEAPEDVGSKDATGRPVIRPIEFRETKVTNKAIAIGVVSVVGALAASLVGRFAFPEKVPAILVAVFALGMAVPLAWAGYTFLRDQELEGFDGGELWGRILGCAVGLAVLWGLYWWLPAYVMDVSSITKIDFVPAMGCWIGLMFLGGLISMIAFDFEYIIGLVHCAVYFVATLTMALIAGIPLWLSR
jgi:hypothetical protein